MQDIRNSAASSVAPGGWMIVTGGTVRGKKLHSVEEYNGREWSCGPPLPMRTSGHCQIQAGNRTIIFGKYIVFFTYYVYPFL